MPFIPHQDGNSWELNNLVPRVFSAFNMAAFSREAAMLKAEKTLGTRLRIEPVAVFGIDHRCYSDFATRLDERIPCVLKMLCRRK